MIRVGDPSIAWQDFRECQDQKDVYFIEKGAERLIGTTTEKVVKFEQDGAVYLKRTQSLLTNEIGNRIVELVVEHDTFRPISLRDEFVGTDVYEFDYSTVTQEVFDLFSVEMMLRLLPLQENYEESVLIYGTEGEAEEVTIKVVRQETFAGHSCWVVEVNFGFAFQTYWIASETQGLLKQSGILSTDLIMEFR